MTRWLTNPARPWVPSTPPGGPAPPPPGLLPPLTYYRHLYNDFSRLDIAGIDNDRSFVIPLDQMYARLRVKSEDETPAEDGIPDAGPIGVQTALRRFPRLVIVGDPGSGKSTFLKYVTLMLARSAIESDPAVALTRLCLPEPLPVPIFLSCWDLSDFLKDREGRLPALIDFACERLKAAGLSLSAKEVELLLESGRCCVLFDGLDEVPTDAHRAVVSRLVEDCVSRYAANRYDIEPFDETDRAEFLRNWVRLLFKVPAGDPPTSEAAAEFDKLTASIEGNDRIRPLAVNPLRLVVGESDRSRTVSSAARPTGGRVWFGHSDAAAERRSRVPLP